MFRRCHDGRRQFSGGEVDSGQRALNDPYPVQPAESVEWDPVVTGPVLGARQPDAEFLAADQPGLDRDADDVGVTGEPDRGEDTDVPESRDHNAFAAHIAGDDRKCGPTIGKL